MSAVPHPRDVFDWCGPTDAEDAFGDAHSRGRLHHAWLVVGPEGSGKATFAYRAARRLLGARARDDLGRLGAEPDDPVCRQIAARAHPDLLVLQRDPEDGRARTGIPADEARELPEFFAKTPAASPWRVAIVDAADDLNTFGANALLKTLEEPPPRGVLLLVAHAPGALPATLRSRCRRLHMALPGPEPGAAFVAERAEVSTDEATALLAMAGGAPGRAWRLAGQGALEADAIARRLIDMLPKADESARIALAESFRGEAGKVRFAVVLERLAALAVERGRAAATGEGPKEGTARAERWAAAFAAIAPLPERSEAVNLDRADVLFTTLARLKTAAC